MENTEKLRSLSALSEAELRHQVLIPLLGRMGFRAATELHGHVEHGKDIVAFDYGKLKQRSYLAVVAKAGDLTGAVSEKRGVREVLFQVEGAFDTPYRDLFDVKEIQIDEVWVVTSGRITPNARESLFGTLQKRHLERRTRFVSGEQLVALIDEHFESYWSGIPETVDELKAQRDRAIRFCSDLLQKLGASTRDAQAVTGALMHSADTPLLRSVDVYGAITHASPYGVEVATIQGPYKHDFYSSQCGVASHAFVEARKALQYVAYEIEDLLESFARVLKQSDPEAFLASFEERLEHEYPFDRARFGRRGEASDQIGYLDDGVRELKPLVEALRAAGKLEWAGSLVDSVKALSIEVATYLSGVSAEKFDLKWYFDAREAQPTLTFLKAPPSSEQLVTLTTSHKLAVPESVLRPEKTRPIAAQDVVEEVQIAVRHYLDEAFPAVPAE